MMNTSVSVNNSELKHVKMRKVKLEPYSWTVGVCKMTYYILLQTLSAQMIYIYRDRISLPLMLLATVGAISTGDFLAGWVHYLLDNYRGLDEYAALVWGKPFVSQYASHHSYPDDILTYNFFETNSDGMFATGNTLTMAYLWMRFYPGAWTSYSVAWMWFWMVFCLFVGFTNQCHKWSHVKNPTGVLKVLQKLHLVLPPDEHQRHHQNPKVALCLTTGWCNPILETIEYWLFAKKTIRSLVWFTRPPFVEPSSPFVEPSSLL
jgi:hypothetical protein